MGQMSQLCPLDQSARAKDQRVGLAGGLWAGGALSSLMPYVTVSATDTARTAER